MGDFLRALLEALQFLWPGRKVMQWEEGCYYRFGKYKKNVGPGIYWVIPWLMEIKEYSTQRAIVSTPRQDITLKNGTVLHFSMGAWAKIENIFLAVNTVDSYQESTQEVMMRVAAFRLADVDADRLLPERRGRLLADLTKWVNEETTPFGVNLNDLTFTTFVQSPKTYRFLVETGAGLPTTW